LLDGWILGDVVVVRRLSAATCSVVDLTLATTRTLYLYMKLPNGDEHLTRRPNLGSFNVRNMA